MSNLDVPVRVESNARMDFFGPWVDVDPWRRELGQDGATLNVPISLTATVEASWRSKTIRISGPSGSHLVNTIDDLVELHSRDSGAREEIEAKIIEDVEVDTSLKLARAAVVRLGISGVSITTDSNAPAGSGVGSSSAMAVGIIKALNLLSGGQMTLEEIIRMAREIETADLGISGGWQDYYPAAYGRGVHFMVWGGGEYGGNLHEQIVVPDGFIGYMNQCVVFVYSGRSRLSGDIHQHVYGALREDRHGVRDAFAALTRQAYEGRDAFRAGNYERVCELVNDSWRCQKTLHESVTNPEIEDLFNCALANGAAAGKAGGAGGGGCLMFLVEGVERRDSLIAALEQHISKVWLAEARILDCKILA